jgi:hypothetical protein
MPDEMPRSGVTTAAWTILAILEVPVFFNGITPPLSMVATSGRDVQTSKPEVKYWTRRGEIVAGVLALVVASILSWAADSGLPFWAGVVTVAIHVYLYEHALKGGVGLAPNPFA